LLATPRKKTNILFFVSVHPCCCCSPTPPPLPPPPPSRSPIHRWDEALAAYEGKLCVTQPSSQEYLTALLGKMRCLASLAEWEKLSSLCR